ncbi:hypothetical protein PAHAL_5G081600 [Panicum hallii]|jgi:hypothetical protein|uniref:Uncharacterized protein n=1 Tax=Panicum hallii TaxID=206008 RepID=A0A2T8IJC9_9POAL|nr:hypothetical protein PAHAL_5G081600 [Panicum hallii]
MHLTHARFDLRREESLGGRRLEAHDGVGTWEAQHEAAAEEIRRGIEMGRRGLEKE